ncbi:hypothetical protein RDI58_013081 [Solanum bulbocastanum]|uniref:Uncharacterized protein n=1 Tax=Solanum bulbocastanum TaxID=147425 RepID=A0AAN8YEA3_SOLBU
MILTMVRCTT